MGIAMAIIGLAVGLYVVAYVMFPAVTAMFSVDTSSWDASAVALIAVLVILAILAVAVLIFKKLAGGKTS